MIDANYKIESTVSVQFLNNNKKIMYHSLFHVDVLGMNTPLGIFQNLFILFILLCVLGELIYLLVHTCVHRRMYFVVPCHGAIWAEIYKSYPRFVAILDNEQGIWLRLLF